LLAAAVFDLHVDVQPEPDRPILWPAIGTLVFVLTVPATVVGVVPYLLSRWKIEAPLLGWSFTRWIGVLVFILGAPIFTDFILRFVREGRGTPAPIAPTQHLVVRGCFRYVRNPGYVGVLAMISGQGLFFGSRAIMVYAALVAVAFHLFVVLYEEPTLRRQFGDQYASYCRRVPRWIPRIWTKA
jgi:protein-S-isoprenylcysteine O-methyltransferase Ste14